ncbi:MULTISPECIES: DHA2 family efflux MFS transporter permease subunit [unclassified Lebetimonas]|uniref:DHA2 family efflux MFS transporter permease subunit n=1 Tax=unclassified Lebetimonas TaxID=2648158 RepID=UPI000464E8FF|nr:MULTISPECIES: DHA2 family efflux MFS transporter permease subunit [unclassified Lebetimonas]
MQPKLFTFNFTLYIILIITGAFMAVLDTTIVDIVVPRLKGPLSTDMYGVQWVITAYMTAAAAGLLVVEWLIKRYGNKWVYIVGVGLFSLASFLCGVSNSLGFIISARVVQGFAEALIMVTAHMMIFSLFPDDKKGIAMGIFALGVAFAPAIGPTLGGYLTEWFSWRAVFFVNVPIGIIIVIFGSLLLPDIGKKENYSLNIISFAFLSISTVALLIMLSKGQQFGWFNSSFIVYLAFVSWIAFLFFLISEYFSKNKLFDYSLFKNPFYTLGILIYFVLLGFSMYQYFYMIPVFYEHIKGLSSIQAGLGVLGFGIWIGIVSIVAGNVSDKTGPIPVLTVAVIIYLITSFYLFPPINYYMSFSEAVLRTMPFGISMGMFFAPVTVLIMNAAKNKGEQAIVVMDYVRFVGGSFGTAIATNSMFFYQAKEYDGIVTLQNYSMVSDLLEKLRYAFGVAGDVLLRDLQEFMAMNYGFKYVWLNAAFWGLLGSVFVFLLPIAKRWVIRNEK